MPYRVRTFLDAGTLDDVISRDYVHVFLSRDPVKSATSNLAMGYFQQSIPTGEKFYLFFFSGYEEVFSKEMPYRVRTFLEAGTLNDVIPRDYVHVFLIRDPVKSITSYLHVCQNQKAVPTGNVCTHRAEMQHGAGGVLVILNFGG